MSTNQKSPTSVDLEETAELPILPSVAQSTTSAPSSAAAISTSRADDDNLSSTDTWAVPKFSAGVGSAVAAHSEPRDDEIGHLRTEVAEASASRGRLELNLQNLTSNLRELEQLLNTKSEQLSVFEREVGQRDRRIAQLEAQLTSLGEERSAVSMQRDALQEQLSASQAQVTAAREQAARSATESSAMQKQHASLSLHVRDIEADLTQAQAHAERYRETLQTLEGRRHVFEAMLLDGDQAVSAREQRISTLERELGERSKHSGARENELLDSLRTEQERVRTQDAALAALRSERETLQTRAESADKAFQARVAGLEAQLQTQGETMRIVEERVKQGAAREQDLHLALRTEQERTREQDSALAVLRTERGELHTRLDSAGKSSQDRIHELEQQLQTQIQTSAAQAERAHQLEQREEELRVELRAERGRTEAAARTAQQRVEALEVELRTQGELVAELRTRMGAVRDSLEQRNALIMRLEAETASSAAVLGNIQENLQHMGQGEPKRMLVRTEGDTGIVQLLGRKTTIGRTPDNDLRIDADFISRHHAVVLFSGAKTVIEDLNSTNGTYVNGERISRRMLNEGDLVTIGKTEFRFVAKPSTENGD